MFVQCPPNALFTTGRSEMFKLTTYVTKHFPSYVAYSTRHCYLISSQYTANIVSLNVLIPPTAEQYLY